MSTIQRIFFQCIDDAARLFLGLFIFCAVFFLMKNISVPDWAKAALNKTDRLSYDIYLIHMIFIKGCLSLIGRFTNPVIDTAVILFVILVSAIILYIISHCLQRQLKILGSDLRKAAIEK